ncbi:MAG TPA: sugar transferase [Thermoanaerobaculia bacterium]|nr:sugar transferase [Thermoanaerobaculia bacterium]
MPENFPTTNDLEQGLSGSPPSLPSGAPRWFEVSFALLALILTSPLLLLAICAIALTRGPLLFRQERVGQGGRTFTLVKLRTMRAAREGSSVTARHDPRVTLPGRLLRLTKLDELPELWTVIKGDLALVGPRPEVPRYVDVEDPLWRRVLLVRPGITSPASLELRNEEELLSRLPATERDEAYRSWLLRYKLARDLSYLEKRTWGSDLRVLARTALLVALPRLAKAPQWEEIRRLVTSGGDRS